MSFVLPSSFSGWSPGGPGGALSEVGETLHQVAVARDELDVNVKHAFIDPLQDLHNMELKDIRVRSVICPVFEPQWIGPEGRVSFKGCVFCCFFCSSVPAEEDEWPSAGFGLQEETERESPGRGGPAGLGQVHHIQRAGREEHVRPAAE